MILFSYFKINPTKTQLTFDAGSDQYERLAELYEQVGNKTYARLFYEKALKYTSDSRLRKLYQLKIESLNVKIN